jgi:WD40 repeat protein
MRRALTLLAVAAWLGVHAWLWTLLPPVPRWTVQGFVPHSFAFTPDGRSLVTADPAEVIVWNTTTGRRERTIPRPGRRPTDSDRQAVMMMSPTDRRVIVYGAGGSLSQRPYLIDIDTGKADALSTFADMVPGDDPVIGFLPGGRAGFQLAVSLADGGDVVMRLWDLPDGPRRTFPIESRLYHDLSFSADGRRAVAVLHKLASAPGTIQILDIVGARITHTLRFDRKVVRAALSADGRTAAISTCPIYEGGAQGVSEVELWDADSGRRISSLGAGLGRGWTAAGQLLVLNRQTVRLLRAPDGAEVARWSAPESNDIYSGELTADGRFLVVTHTHYLPDAVRWWYERLPGQPFDPNRSTEHYAIFDAQTGRELANLGTGKPKQVTLAADGSAFAIADVDVLWFYDIPPRIPGGIVLGLMIAEVGLFTAWTAWRRRLFRKRLAAATA